jgi:hypothetical protein
MTYRVVQLLLSMSLLGLWSGVTFAAATTNGPTIPHSPPFPASRSPVEAFRELLATPRSERATLVAERSFEVRKAILAKLREYDSLRADQRELRLKVTELRWYLLPLMNAPATNRTEQLARIPESMRDLVAVRIREWDALSPEVRNELLQNEATLRYFTEMDSSSSQQLSSPRREKLEAGIKQWQALPEDRRREIAIRFVKFFDLSDDEKSRALTVLSDAERKQIEKTLKAYEHLPEEQRQQCINSFQRFASLSPQERQDFLKNAERWKLMEPEERQSWRELVHRLSTQPPLPSMKASPAQQIRKRITMAPLPIGASNSPAQSRAAQLPQSLSR